MAGGLGRAGPAHRLAPARRAVALGLIACPCGPDHARLCAGRAGRGVAPALGVRYVLSGPARGDGRLRAAGDGRGRLDAARPAAFRYGHGRSSSFTSTWGSRSPSLTRSSPVSGFWVTRSPRRSDRGVGVHRGDGHLVRVGQPIWRTRGPVPAAGRRGARRGTGRGFGHLPRPAAGPAGGVGRPVLPVAFLQQGPVVAGAPVFAVRAAASPVPPGDGQGAGRPEPRGRAARPGTRVAIEGPYGAFTHHARIYDRVVLVGAGVGITPLRALLEDLPAGTDVVVIVRASSARELIHRDEVAALAASAAASSTRSSARAAESIRRACAAAPGSRPGRQRRVRLRTRPVQRGSHQGRVAEGAPRSGSTGKRSGTGREEKRTSRHLPEDQLDEAIPGRDTGDRGGPAGVLAFHTSPARLSAGDVARGFRDLGDGRLRRIAAGPGHPRLGFPATVQPGGARRAEGNGAVQPGGTRTATGPAVNYNYGVLSVSVTVTGSKITKGRIASLEDGGNHRPQFIDQQSIPLLEQEAVQAQSATSRAFGRGLHQRWFPPIAPVRTAKPRLQVTAARQHAAPPGGPRDSSP